MEAARQDRRSECRRCREHGYIERGVDQEGHEAEDSPEAPRAVRARGEVPLEVQGVQRLSARSSALYVQGVRWCINLRARSSAHSVQGVRWASICEHGRERSKCKECGGSGICEHGRQRSRCKECGGASICEHGRRRSDCKECGGSQNLRARSSALSDARSVKAHACDTTSATQQTAMMEAFGREERKDSTQDCDV